MKTLNLPNRLSLLRICLVPVLVCLMYAGSNVCDLLAAAVFVIGCLTDYFDGKIARSRGLITTFGKFIDPVADKLLVLSSMIMLSARGILPAWLVIIVLARELLVDALRLIAAGTGRVIAAGPLGKLKTASQMLVLLILMLIRLPATSVWFGWVMVIWVAGITVWSGVDYFMLNRDVLKEG